MITTINWEAVSALSNVIAAFAAVFILYEARQIRRGHAVQKHNANWNEFNRIILEGNNISEYNAFIYNNSPNLYDPRHRVNWILFCWLNTLESICIDIARGQMPFRRGYDIIIDQLRIMILRKDYISNLMRDRGYSNDTILLFEDYFERQEERIFEDNLRKYTSRLKLFYSLR